MKPARLAVNGGSTKAHRSAIENPYSKINNAGSYDTPGSTYAKRLKLVNNNTTNKSVKENGITIKSIPPPSNCTIQAVKAFVLEEKTAFHEVESVVEDTLQSCNKYFSNCDSIKQLMKTLIDNKINKNKEEFEDAKIRGLKLIMEMKYLHRLDKLRGKEARNRLDEAKQRVETILFALENIKYQINHLQKEKKVCDSFKSKDETLDLVDVREFYSAKDIDQAFIEAASQAELHTLHLDRLKWEIEKRIEWKEKQIEMEKKKALLIQQIVEKKKQLSLFEPALHSIVEACKPLTSKLELPMLVMNQENILTAHLARPLYILYIQLTAHRYAFESGIEILILGTADDAINYESNRIEKLKRSELNDDDERETRKKSKKSKRKSTQKFDPIDDIEPIMKKSKYFEAHPLRVQMNYRFQGRTLKILFSYFPNLEIIGLRYDFDGHVQMNSDPTLLNGMFVNLLTSNDIGDQCPNPVTEQHLLKDLSYSPQTYFDEIGFTHFWAQKLGGIEFLHSLLESTSSKVNTIRIRDSIAKKAVDNVVNAIKIRFEARVSLQNQISEIASKLNKLGNSKAILKSFMKITVENFHKILEDYPRVELFKEYFGSLNHPEDIQMFSAMNFLYRLVFETDGVNFVCVLVLPYQYPQKWPFMVILTECAWWNIDVWMEQLEKHVNIDLPLRTSQNDKDYVQTMLTQQIDHLQSGFVALMNAKKQMESIEHDVQTINHGYSGPNSLNLISGSKVTTGLNHELVSMFES